MSGNAATMKLGPNDMSDVVWAHSNFFSFLFHDLIILTTVLWHIQLLNYEIRDIKWVGRWRRQKWAQMTLDGLFQQ